ncbi:YfgM family protein [Veronia pacifica]|uniref:Ancillary SecYEG translocon subunit n=1 Tax=Veronia pacifica TaxID=1080227 RepID=A0A1C3EGH1_9GAMM|nr:tetratricopeptide repeat protein [Veronia pacifica]ODA32321.1 hypothetical protein A8L45_13410 [Veronia pacifica]
MDVNTTEEQQVEEIKKWFKENGKAVILGAVLGLGGLYGWRYYQAETISAQEQASDAYNKVISALTAGDGQQAAEDFIKQNEGQAYAALAALQLAKSQVEKGELTAAADQLRVVQSSGDDALKAVATSRLARVEAELGNFDEALAELDKVTADSWKANVAELRGDILVKKGNLAGARDAYAASIAAADNTLVQMKLDNLTQ